MMTYGLCYGVASVVNAQFGLRLLEVATNCFPAEFEKVRDLPDRVAN